MLDPNLDGGNILALDDPELFKYPVAYLCEPGFWTLTEAEVAGLRAYLLKGGFLIVDDFVGPALGNFEEQMRKVLPAGRLVELDELATPSSTPSSGRGPARVPAPYSARRPSYLGSSRTTTPPSGS